MQLDTHPQRESSWQQDIESSEFLTIYQPSLADIMGTMPQ
jgi:hypothetical protein